MVCNLRFIWGKWGELDYKWQVTEDSETFRERKKARASCSGGGVLP